VANWTRAWRNGGGIICNGTALVVGWRNGVAGCGWRSGVDVPVTFGDPDKCQTWTCGRIIRDVLSIITIGGIIFGQWCGYGRGYSQRPSTWWRVKDVAGVMADVALWRVVAMGGDASQAMAATVAGELVAGVAGSAGTFYSLAELAAIIASGGGRAACMASWCINHNGV